jgi:disulfide bond formation protein DsbB
MNLTKFEVWKNSQRLLGVVAILIGAGAWALELSGVVYVCPYCRVQRTVIIMLGLMMLMPDIRHWIYRYVAFVIGFFGAVVAANQNFLSWKLISSGEFSWGEQWYVHPLLLSAGALFIIVGQVGLMLVDPRESED